MIERMQHVQLLESLAEIYPLGPGEVSRGTHVPGVNYFRVTEGSRRTPQIYEPGIVILGQGHKVVYFEGKSFRYDPETYFILSVSVPLECEVYATPTKPLMGILINLDPAWLRELTNIVADNSPPDWSSPQTPTRGFEPAPLDEDMAEAVGRLLRCMRDPAESAALGKARVREIVYRAIRGPHGPALHALTQHHSVYARVARAQALIHSDFRQPVSVELLARQVAMSTSAFHRAFKRVTGQSPLQYTKKIRLNRARDLIATQRMAVSVAAAEVGYESPSQFSREFKRYFQVSPSSISGAP